MSDIDVLFLAEQDIHFNRKKSSRTKKKGPCPNHFKGECSSDDDGFSVELTDDGWRFMCRGCWDAAEYLPQKNRKRGFGDAIDYLRHFRGMTYPEARAYLEGENPPPRKLARRDAKEPYDWRSDVWQRDAINAIKVYEARLWQPEHTSALDYARSRGITDETIRKAHIGLTLKWDIPRLTFPNYNHKLKRLTAVHRRDLRPEAEDRWKDSKGSTKDFLYLNICLQRKRPTVLAEGIFDALSLAQEVGDIVNVVATGGVGCGRTIANLAQLARMPLVLVAFDADVKGDAWADEWLKRLKNARRLRPFLHDVNDQLVQGWDIRQWVIDALAHEYPLLTVSERCQECEQQVDYYSNEGIPYCQLHGPAGSE